MGRGVCVLLYLVYAHVCVNEIRQKHFQAGIFGLSHNAILPALHWYESWSHPEGNL
jgi:hypothetical protein